MKQIRKSVFETNSSSSHSLTLGKGDLAAEPFPKYAQRAGAICVDLGQYNWGWHRYYSAEEKIAYLVTQLFQYGELEALSDMTPAEISARLCAENPRLAQLNRVVSDYTGCVIEINPGTGEIDHQSQGVGDELYESDEKLRQFLFDPTAYIQTGNDNDSPPWTIDSDRGTDHYYAAHMREVPVGYVGVELTLPDIGRQETFFTAAGAALSPKINTALRSRLLEEGILTFALRNSAGPIDFGGRGDSCADCASTMLDERRRMHFSNDFEAKSVFTKTPEHLPEVLILTVQLPAALAAEIQALPSTPEVLVKLERAENEAEYVAWRAALATASDDDRTQWLQKKAELDALRTEAQVHGELWPYVQSN